MPRAKKAKAANAVPVCRLCGRSGAGVTFAIFNPKVPPFGTCCTDCESTLPPGPVDLEALLSARAVPVARPALDRATALLFETPEPAVLHPSDRRGLR